MISKLFTVAVFALASLLPATGCLAAPAGKPGALPASYCAGKPFYAADTALRKLLRFSADGKLEWEYDNVYCYDMQLLANGNLLFCDSTGKSSRTVELDPKTKTAVWEYKSKGEVFSCRRLANGNTLVGECSQARIVEVDAKGTVVRTIALKAAHKGHAAMRLFEPAADGTLWVAHLGDKFLRQYGMDGKVRREIACPFMVFGVLSLPKERVQAWGLGSVVEFDVLAWGLGAVVKFDAAGKVVWTLKNTDFAGEHVFVTGVEKLPNGNLLVTQWLGHGQEGKGIPAFEVTPDNRTVWRFADDAKQTKNVAVVRMVP